MNRLTLNIALLGLLLSATCATAAETSKNLFNGKNLDGWQGDKGVWSVEDGAIVGRTTAENPIKNNTFLVWRDGKVDDVRLTLEYKIEGGNSGVQYRSKLVDPEKWIVAGYQADIDSGPNYTGILYEERGRGILAKRGERVTIDRTGESETESFADAVELQESINTDDWNKYEIEVVGSKMRHSVNGHLMSETIDRAADHAASSGILALQVHQGPPMVVRFRNIMLTPLNHADED